MNGPRQKPNNMNELCRLCLADDEITSPIFGEEDSSSETQIPLSFRIMACVSVEVSLSDGLPNVICEKCLFHINSWHDFKQICDLSQATLKEWQNNGKENPSVGEKDIIIKQEPIDLEPEDEILEILEDADSNQFMVEDIKQEVDMYEEDQQDSLSVEAVDAEYESLGVHDANVSNTETKETENEDVEVVPQAGDVSHIRITDIKTECNDVIPIGELTSEPSEGRLLRSVLQGKKLSMYSKKISASRNGKLSFQSVKPFNCRLCDKSFSYNYLLKRHEKTHTGDRNVCAYCQKGFSSHASLVQHVRFFSGANSMSYFCEHCNLEFACRTMYLSHVDGSDGSGCDVVLANKDDAEDLGELQEANGQCEVCNEIFPSLMLLRLHMRKEHLHYSCHKCDKSYSNGVALSNHLRGHSIGSVRHQCESCPRTFPSLDLLKKHERTHMKESTAMTIIPSDVLSKSAEFSDMSLPLTGVEAFLDRPIKEEPPDSPEIPQEEEQQVIMENFNFQQSHVCYLCNEHFPTVASLRFHMKGVHLHYQCHRCPKIYSSGVALSNHLRSHSISNYKKHKCLACLKSFTTLDLLNKHKKIHSAPAVLKKVRKKSKKFRPSEFVANDVYAPSFGESAENEIAFDEPLVKRTCKVCGLVSASPSALERHMACHTKEKMYTCSVCHVSMSYASSLQKHYRLIHNKHVELRAIQKNAVVDGDAEIASIPAVQKSKGLIPGSSETSTRSGRKVIFNRTFRMTAQLQQAHLPTPYECKVCHRSFAYRSFLLKHSKVHSNGQPGATCPICLKKFPDAKALNNHKGVHTRFKHYTCHVCGKSFNGLNAWQKHERMHQKGFIYSCKLCGKRFLSKAELHEHKKMHIKLKIYTCTVCKNSYHSSSALGKHKRRHSHWYASQKSSEMEIVNGYTVAPTKAPVTKPALSKGHAIKQPSLKTTIVRSGVSKASISRILTHFPSGKRRPYCFTCNKTFSHMSALRKHKLLHERIEIEKKPGFPEKFNAESTVVTEENTCITCNRTFPDHVSLVRHKGWHTRRGNPSAESASVPASGKMPVNPCFVKAEPPALNAYQCSLCSKTFTTSIALESHVKSHTEAIIKGTNIERSKVSADLDISEVLTSQRRLACKICKKPFDSKKALITHIGWHSRDSHLNNPSFNSHKTKSTPKLTVEKYSCNVCHKLFSSATILGKHKKLHTRKLMSSIKEKSGEISETVNSDALFTCNVCSKSFKLHKYLQLHIRLHTGEKRFKCTMCPQAYHRSGSLWKHKRTHHGVKVFSCPVCQKRFGLKNQLKKHMEIHKSSVDLTVGDTVFTCSRCNKTFPNLTKFKQHQKINQCHLG